MDRDRICTVTFEPAECSGPRNLVLRRGIVDGAERYEACRSIRVGAYQVLGSGQLELSARRAVAIRNRFRIEQGGRLVIELDPAAGADP